MIHLKYECKVNFVKLPLISIYRCLKMIFENATAGRNTGCRSVVKRAGSSLSPHALGTAKVAKNSDPPADRRGSHEGVYGN